MPSTLTSPRIPPACPNRPSPRVLIVDDCEEDRHLYQRLLGRQRWQFLEAETGEEGLTCCQETRPDCVLLDYQLPDLDGLEFMNQLSGMSGAGQVPVIMLTGQGNEAVAVQAVKHGVEDYLSKKDLTAEILERAIRSA